jgi:probable phosphoglycerate mutase
LTEGRSIYFETMDRWKEGDLEATHEGGESYRQMQNRVVPEFVRLAEENRGETIIVVAHGVVIRVLLTSLLEDKGPADFESFAIDFVAVNDLSYDGETWKAVSLNGLGVGVT